MTPTQFRSDRLFYQSAPQAQGSGWYYTAREGAVFGPFTGRGLAQAHLQRFITYCKQNGETGGRDGAVLWSTRA